MALSETMTISQWMMVGVGVAVLAIIINVEPKLGGWLLLLLVLGLAFSQRGLAILTGK